MRRRRKTPFVIFALWLCIGMVGFLFGYYLAPTKGEKGPLHIVEEPNQSTNRNRNKDLIDDTTGKNKEEDQTVSSHDIVVGEDTNVVFRTMYDKCKTINDDVHPPSIDMIGLKEGEFKEFAANHLQDWQIVRFSGDEVVLYQMKDQYCPNHYFVMEDEGFIAIYQYDKDGNRKLVEKTQIPTTNLPKVDQDKLKNGIPLDTREKVDQLLEDYSG